MAEFDRLDEGDLPGEGADHAAPGINQASEFAAAAAVAWRTYHPEGDAMETELLSPSEERRLAYRILRGDQEARAQLIAANYRLVFHVVSRFRHTGVPIEDLIQEGNLGLIEAVDRFDPRRGYRFNTYALVWIRGAILRAVTRLRAVIPVPERMAQTAARLRREEDLLAQELGREPSADEVANKVGVSAGRVEEARLALRQPTSLEQPDTDDGRAPEEWLVQSGDRPAEMRLAQAELREALLAQMSILTPREREVLHLRYGLDTDEPRSLAEVGRVLDISRQRARELEQSALRRLRQRPPRGFDAFPIAAAGD